MTDSPTAAAEQGYRHALDLLRTCAKPYGFVASAQEHDNYRRVWSRDGVIMGLAALLTGEPDLVAAFRATLATLAAHQGPHGEIPSNVAPEQKNISYGGTAGRVDADLWFGIGLGQYARATGDEEFLEEMRPALESVRFLLGAWEFNNRGLLYVPQTGDWSDEFLQNGYILSDQLLYLQFQREFAYAAATLDGAAPDSLLAERRRLSAMIRSNYWFATHRDVDENVYHKVLYEKGRRAGRKCMGRHWLPYFSPLGYGYRFDTLGNVLASLLHVADGEQARRVDEHIDQHVRPEGFPLLPAFHPVIRPSDESWDDLQAAFSYSFKNEPYEFHNGGLWPMVTGFYAADLARRGLEDPARTYLEGIHRANALESDGRPWSFPEYVHGKEFTPGGVRQQGWSAAAAIIAHEALRGETPFRGDEHEREDAAL